MMYETSENKLQFNITLFYKILETLTTFEPQYSFLFSLLPTYILTGYNFRTLCLRYYAMTTIVSALTQTMVSSFCESLV